jgi:Cu-processing system permease protein
MQRSSLNRRRRVVIAIARRELAEAISNRWLIGYAIGFAVLALALSRAGISAAGYGGLGGFGRTAASLINALVLFVPLFGLTMGANAIAGDRERGSLLYLLAQPVSRGEVLFGKALGTAAALIAAVSGGFGLASLALIGGPGGDGLSFFGLAVLTMLLGAISLGHGMALGSFFQRTAPALGAAMIVWLVLVFLGDLSLIATTLALHPKPSTLLAMLLINPLQAFKLLAVYTLRSNLDALGSVGHLAMREFGAGLPWLLAAVMSVWAIIGFAVAQLRFSRQADA